MIFNDSLLPPSGRAESPFSRVPSPNREVGSKKLSLKSLLRFKVKAGPSVQPQEYSKYFED
jgi:hypothetical protein